jgi:hypothetical protein
MMMPLLLYLSTSAAFSAFRLFGFWSDLRAATELHPQAFRPDILYAIMHARGYAAPVRTPLQWLVDETTDWGSKPFEQSARALYVLRMLGSSG